MAMTQAINANEIKLDQLKNELEMKSALEDRWRQINDMSLDEFKSASDKTTDYGKYKISEAFGALGTYNENGTCSGGEPSDSSKKACRVATLTVKDKDGNSVLGPISATRVASAQKSVGGGSNTLVTITESQNWIAPVDGWYKFTIKGAGSGGNAGSYASNYGFGGVGGAEGGTTIAFEKLKKGDTIPITIGIGGAGGTGRGGRGQAGQDSSITCNGKTYVGGGGGQVTGTYGGLGGSGTIPGNPGTSSHTDTANGHLGHNGAGAGGGIVTGYYTRIDGTTGGGGAGGYGSYNGYYSAGGKGGDGVVWIEYYDPNKG